MLYKLDKRKYLHLDMVQESGLGGKARGGAVVICSLPRRLSALCSNPFFMYSLFDASLSTVTISVITTLFISPNLESMMVFWLEHSLPHFSTNSFRRFNEFVTNSVTMQHFRNTDVAQVRPSKIHIKPPKYPKHDYKLLNFVWSKKKSFSILSTIKFRFFFFVLFLLYTKFSNCW